MFVLCVVLYSVCCVVLFCLFCCVVLFCICCVVLHCFVFVVFVVFVVLCLLSCVALYLLFVLFCCIVSFCCVVSIVLCCSVVFVVLCCVALCLLCCFVLCCTCQYPALQGQLFLEGRDVVQICPLFPLGTSLRASPGLWVVQITANKEQLELVAPVWRVPKLSKRRKGSKPTAICYFGAIEGKKQRRACHAIASHRGQRCRDTVMP